MQKQLPSLKLIYPWLKEADSTALQQSVVDLDQAYQNFFRRVKQGKTPGFPKFHNRGRHNSFTVKMALDSEDDWIKIGKLGWFKTRGSWERLENKKIRRITVSKDGKRWFASCLVETENTAVNHKHKYESCGVDLGVSNPLTIAYESGSSFLGIKTKTKLEKLELRRKRYQRSYARKYESYKIRKKKEQIDKDTGEVLLTSKQNLNKAQARIQDAFYKERCVRNNFIEKASNLLASNFKTIVFENLKISNMTRAVKKNEDGSPRKNVAAKSGLNREMLRLGLATLLMKTKQKAEKYGSEVRLVNPAYTSQTCNSCGTISKKSRKSQAVFKCISCGHRDHADKNAARNILLLGTR